MSYPWTNFSSNPKLDANAVKRRLDLFVGGKYANSNLSSILYADRVDGQDNIDVEIWSAPGKSRPTFDEAKKRLDGGSGKKLEKGTRFGPSFIFDPSCEAMVFDNSGDALQGITGGSDYNRRVEYIIPREEVSKGKCLRYIEVTANGMFGLQPNDQEDENIYYDLATVELVSVNMEVQKLMWDFDTLQQVAVEFPQHSPVGNKARDIANRIMNTFNGSLGSVKKCRELAEEVLGLSQLANVDVKGKPQKGTLWAIGYCHIDTAWLWPWSSTQQKIARSWSSQLDLMDRYPDYRFMASAAQHFAWLEELYPPVFERLKGKIASGQFEISGGCWVEMDGTIAGGEASSRQFLYGQQYFQQKFGKKCDTLVLPDTFGFSGQLPQISRLGGCPYFFNNRVGLNKVDTFPLTNFNWAGIDGTQVLTHITPIHRYDSLATMTEIVRGYGEHQNIEDTPDAVLAFGHGDGGGGPRPLLLERVSRARGIGMKSLGQSAEMPLVKQGSTLSEFFDHVRQDTKEGAKLPVWNGELYLQAMRGYFTSQANTKRSFRKAEILMREVELVSTLASLRSGYAYPKERLDKTWQSLCLCMFHDTLPGTSIRFAVRDYDAAFAEIHSSARNMLQSALRAVSGRDARSKKSMALNLYPSVPRREIVKNDSGELLLAEAPAGDISMSIASFKPEKPVTVHSTAHGLVLENASLRIEMNEGRIARIYDTVSKRELLAPGKTAGFTLYEDYTSSGDAWEIDQTEWDKFQHVSFKSCQVTTNDPLRATVECQVAFGSSTGRVTMTLDAVSPTANGTGRGLLAFDCHFEWHERNKLLKFELPLTLHSDFATFDCAFGVMRRPTTRNFSWEAERYEVATHKFADYSEHGYGVAILNDCKYGYSAQGSLLTISCLRAPTLPDAQADQGPHDFQFGVYPHTGTFAESDVQQVAHAFNNPLRVLPGNLAAEYTKMPIVAEGANNVLLETVKRAEDDFDEFSFVEKDNKVKTVICRLHEHMGGHANVNLVIRDLHVEGAELVNTLEETMGELDVTTDSDQETIDLSFRPFEIKAVRLRLRL